MDPHELSFYFVSYSFTLWKEAIRGLRSFTPSFYTFFEMNFRVSTNYVSSHKAVHVWVFRIMTWNEPLVGRIFRQIVLFS